MSSLKFKVMYKNGEYEAANGEKKGRWIQVGSVFENDKGMSMILDVVPVGATAPVFLSFFEPKPKDGEAPIPF
jgi:hypothetical protein